MLDGMRGKGKTMTHRIAYSSHVYVYPIQGWAFGFGFNEPFRQAFTPPCRLGCQLCDCPTLWVVG